MSFFSLALTTCSAFTVADSAFSLNALLTCDEELAREEMKTHDNAQRPRPGQSIQAAQTEGLVYQQRPPVANQPLANSIRALAAIKKEQLDCFIT